MKIVVCLFAITAFFALSSVCTAETSAPPSILRTEMYPGGARIVFSVPASGKVQFQLPGAFEVSSVRPVASEGVEVRSFEAVEVSRPEWIPPVLEKLHRSIREKRTESSLLSGKISAIQSSLDLLSAPLPKELKGYEVAQYIESVRDVREKMEMERLALSTSLEEIGKELSVLEAEFQSKMPLRADKAVEVTAVLSGEGNLLVESFTRQAEWQPFYRMNLDSGTGTISGSLFARARQKTGLLIEGSISFHTSMPSASVSPPDLKPLVADFAPKTKSRAFSMDDAMPQMAVMMEAPSPAPAPQPAVVQTLTDLSASAEGILTGDFTFADFNLGNFSLEAEASIVSVPVLSEQAWLVAESKAVPFAILPGSAELSVDGKSSGRTTLKEYGSGSDLLMAFGKTPRVTASREKVVPKEGSSWMGKGRLEDGYTIEVSNGMPHPITLLLKDRIPVSSQEKLTVETVRIDPRPEQHSDGNVLTWRLSLAPGETRTITVLFKLGYPSDETIIFR